MDLYWQSNVFLNILSRLVITFLPRSKHLLISWLQTPSAVISEFQKLKSVFVSIVSPSICHEVMGPDAMILIFWMLSFKPTFSLSSFTFVKRLFSSSLSAIRVVSSAYLRSLTFLPDILILACASSSPAFCMMYSAYKLNKQGDNTQPWYTPFPIWNHCVVPRRFLCYFFTCIQISQEADKGVWYSHLLKNLPQSAVIHTVKCFGIVNKAKVDIFLDLSYFLMIQQMLAIWSLVPLPFLNPAW